MKHINFRTLVWVLMIVGGAFSVYSQYAYQTPPPQGDHKQVCYEGGGEKVRIEFEAPYTIIKVNRITGTMNYNGEEIVGLAQYVIDEDTGATICEVWIPTPEYVHGDDAMDTLGHELLHCISGEFHE